MVVHPFARQLNNLRIRDPDTAKRKYAAPRNELWKYWRHDNNTHRIWQSYLERETGSKVCFPGKNLSIPWAGERGSLYPDLWQCFQFDSRVCTAINELVVIFWLNVRKFACPCIMWMCSVCTVLWYTGSCIYFAFYVFVLVLRTIGCCVVLPVVLLHCIVFIVVRSVFLFGKFCVRCYAPFSICVLCVRSR